VYIANRAEQSSQHNDQTTHWATVESDCDSQQAQGILFFSTVCRHSGAHPVSYSMGTRGSSLWVQRSGEDHWSTCKFQGQKGMEMYLHSPVHIYAMGLHLEQGQASHFISIQAQSCNILKTQTVLLGSRFPLICIYWGQGQDISMNRNEKKGCPYIAQVIFLHWA